MNDLKKNFRGQSLFFLPMVFSLVCFSGCLKTEASYPLGSQKNPVKFYFVPSVDTQTISSNSKDMVKFLHDKTGLYFKTGIPASYIAVVEAFGAKRADFCIMNPFGYLLANKKYGALAKMTMIRHGQATYCGQILAHVDSGIKKLNDINGKRFAFTDASSTSGYLMPMALFKENGIKPSQKVFAVKHDNVVSMIYQRQVDAGATYYTPPAPDGSCRDARMRVKTQFPDVEQKVVIIEKTAPIPNDPLVVRKGIPDEIVKKVINALLAFVDTLKGKSVFYDIYGAQNMISAQDSDYDSLRKIVHANAADAQDLISHN
jgi:phosphonate transport system substrate-binding protein